jgi:hypothetical protein
LESVGRPCMAWTHESHISLSHFSILFSLSHTLTNLWSSTSMHPPASLHHQATCYNPAVVTTSRYASMARIPLPFQVVSGVAQQQVTTPTSTTCQPAAPTPTHAPPWSTARPVLSSSTLGAWWETSVPAATLDARTSTTLQNTLSRVKHSCTASLVQWRGCEPMHCPPNSQLTVHRHSSL